MLNFSSYNIANYIRKNKERYFFIDENARETGLRELRKSNFTIIAENIKSFKPNGGSLLDVGCAHGWFIETVGDDFEVLDRLLREDLML